MYDINFDGRKKLIRNWKTTKMKWTTSKKSILPQEKHCFFLKLNDPDWHPIGEPPSPTIYIYIYIYDILYHRRHVLFYFSEYVHILMYSFSFYMSYVYTCIRIYIYIKVYTCSLWCIFSPNIFISLWVLAKEISQYFSSHCMVDMDHCAASRRSGGHVANITLAHCTWFNVNPGFINHSLLTRGVLPK